MAEPKENPLMEKIVSLCKRRGFIFQSSEIYGGINGFWDYGPLGAELKRNVKELWWNSMTRQRDDVVGLEATIIMHPQIWKASGHVDTFADLMRECPLTKKRVRADQVEPQSGVVYRWTGAESKSSGWKPEKNFALLLRKGENPESARKKAREFYAQGSIDSATGEWTNLELKGETTTTVSDSLDFHPESGAELSEARPFNLMFKTHYGPVELDENIAYLRPETAQAIFAQFKNVLETSRQKVPFGIAQIGKAFRNEVTPRNYTFRSREFEQMELEFFIRPDEVVAAICGNVASASELCSSGRESAHSSTTESQSGLTSAATAGSEASLQPQPNWGWEAWHKYWVEQRIQFYEGIGLPRTTLVEYWQKPEELAHYARATVDILFKFPFSKRDEKGELMGEELEGIAARSDFDLSQHERFSGKPMGVFDDELRAAWGKLDDAKKKELWQRYYENRKKYLTKTARPEETAEQIEKDAKEDADDLAKGQYIPHVIEPSAGVDRLILALICSAYCEDQAPDEKGKLESRVVMKFHPRIAPTKVAVFPLLKNKPDLVRKAQEVRELLRPHMTVFYDEAGAIGRRYRRQDEAGTPFGITIDFDTLGEKGPELKDTVTLRDRDTMQQTRVKIEDLLPLLLEKIR
ncbi:MAG: glycine--tRNA ligase [Verrucomicrobia bacterium]|nr:glycine--tRNA ligase [Verrucomicrobiota bacterium]